MRFQHLKLIKKKSTKAERRFFELFKELHIPFRTKIKIAGREIDFLFGNYAIEIDGHLQDPYKNRELVKLGYNIIHLHNNEVGPHLKDWLKNLCREQISLRQ